MHPIATELRSATEYVLRHVCHGPDFRLHLARLGVALTAVETARALVESDRIEGLTDIARATTERELLEQARALLSAGTKVAAAVLAGGALETHLRGLVDRHGISFPDKGNPGITVYNSAIATHRKSNPKMSVYPASIGDHISGWGKMRNDAAHKPLDFERDRTSADVEEMITGVARFIDTYGGS